MIGIALPWSRGDRGKAGAGTVIVTDYDRTFTRPDLSLSQDALAAAQEARSAGYFMVLATGRRLADLDMAVLAPCFDGFVLEGGAMWGTPGDWAFAQAPDALWHAAEVLSMEAPGLTQGLVSFSAPAELWHHPVLRESGMDVRRNRDRLDVTPAGVDKWSGLQALLERRGMAGCRLAAVGDSENDLPLFLNADLAIAVLDSEPVLVREADVVAPKRADEGFTWALGHIGRTAP